MTGPLVYVRLTRRSAGGETGRCVHLACLPADGSPPTALKALCGKEFRAGEAERLPEIAGMPCVQCLIRSPGPPDRRPE